MSASTAFSSALLVLLATVQLAIAAPQSPRLAFYPDDPLRRDRDDHDIESPQASGSDDLLISDAAASGSGEGDRRPTYALDINTLGEIPDSSWFTNRHGRRAMSLEELRRGPNRLGPPAGGSWRLVGRPEAGRTPKFTIEDADANTFIIKLDSPSHPELASSAEIIGTKFFHAIGYNVPENHLVAFAPEQIVYDDEHGDAVDYRLAILDEAAHDEQGRVRAVASRILEGEPIGPFSYTGTRPDDPNDIFPHQHRRELRGLAVFASWLNHTDTKAGNTLDMLVHEEARQFVRHYLIDFGSILGSAAIGVKDPATGNERYWVPAAILKSVASLSLWVRPYAGVRYPPYPAIGRLEADYYEPRRWQPPVANPAFEQMDAADAFWAARIVSRFDRAAIRAIVSTARISDPEAEATLVNVLEVRRNKIVRYWLTRTNPLDAFGIEVSPSAPRLRFENAAVRLDLTGPVRYRYAWHRFDNESGKREAIGAPAGTDEPELVVPPEAWGPPDPHGLRYAQVDIATVDAGFPHWRHPVVVTLRRATSTVAAESVEVVGIRRPRELPH